MSAATLHKSYDLQEASRVYAIGDIHGCLDLLDQLIAKIDFDLKQAPSTSSFVVTLGDYVDRGPNSRGVIERLAQNPFPVPYVALKGNHEELFEAFLENPSIGSQWRQLGGLETLHSYGVPVSLLMLGKGFHEAADLLREKVPEAHFTFLSSLRTSASYGSFFLCHAGVRPGIPLDRQTPKDLLWIREEFLSSPKDFGKRVVHGHTPTPKPEVLPNRINIDTGAYMTGLLTCVVLEAERHRFLSSE
jgi:serine/threonine protein phosphatase 1